MPIAAPGHAYTRSAPTDFEFITIYAEPKASPITTFTLGTDASVNATESLATFFAIVFSLSKVASNPVAAVSVSTGILNESAKLIKLAALSAPSVEISPFDSFT